MKYTSLLFIIIALYSWNAQAFPEMIRYQYNNCTACHVAPSGGGLLTSYGRSLSSEVLSTWGTEKESGFLHGMIDREGLEQWLLVGGDIRAVQVHKESDVIKTGRFIKMQADFSLGVVREKWAVVGTVGEIEQDDWNPFSTSYYGMLKPSDEISVRAGRFSPQYGVYSKDHIAFVRSFLGFGLDGSRDTGEIQWTGPDWTSNLSYSKQINVKEPEEAVAAQVQRTFADTFKIAVNYWRGHAGPVDRDLYGAWALLGFSKNIFLVSEVDWQNRKINLVTTKSFVTYQKAGYTLFKGFDLLALGEFQKADLDDAATEVSRYGLGFQFYPRPHFEFSGAWTKQKTLALQKGQEADYAWLLLHYYL